MPKHFTCLSSLAFKWLFFNTLSFTKWHPCSANFPRKSEKSSLTHPSPCSFSYTINPTKHPCFVSNLSESLHLHQLYLKRGPCLLLGFLEHPPKLVSLPPGWPHPAPNPSPCPPPSQLSKIKIWVSLLSSKSFDGSNAQQHFSNFSNKLQKSLRSRSKKRIINKTLLARLSFTLNSHFNFTFQSMNSDLSLKESFRGAWLAQSIY